MNDTNPFDKNAIALWELNGRTSIMQILVSGASASLLINCSQSYNQLYLTLQGLADPSLPVPVTLQEWTQQDSAIIAPLLQPQHWATVLTVMALESLYYAVQTFRWLRAYDYAALAVPVLHYISLLTSPWGPYPRPDIARLARLWLAGGCAGLGYIQRAQMLLATQLYTLSAIDLHWAVQKERWSVTDATAPFGALLEFPIWLELSQEARECNRFEDMHRFLYYATALAAANPARLAMCAMSQAAAMALKGQPDQGLVLLIPGQSIVSSASPLVQVLSLRAGLCVAQCALTCKLPSVTRATLDWIRGVVTLLEPSTNVLVRMQTSTALCTRAVWLVELGLMSVTTGSALLRKSWFGPMPAQILAVLDWVELSMSPFKNFSQTVTQAAVFVEYCQTAMQCMDVLQQVIDDAQVIYSDALAYPSGSIVPRHLYNALLCCAEFCLRLYEARLWRDQHVRATAGDITTTLAEYIAAITDDEHVQRWLSFTGTTAWTAAVDILENVRGLLLPATIAMVGETLPLSPWGIIAARTAFLRGRAAALMVAQQVQPYTLWSGAKLTEADQRSSVLPTSGSALSNLETLVTATVLSSSTELNTEILSGTV